MPGKLLATWRQFKHVQTAASLNMHKFFPSCSPSSCQLCMSAVRCWSGSVHEFIRSFSQKKKAACCSWKQGKNVKLQVIKPKQWAKKAPMLNRAEGKCRVGWYSNSDFMTSDTFHITCSHLINCYMKILNSATLKKNKKNTECQQKISVAKKMFPFYI